MYDDSMLLVLKYLNEKRTRVDVCPPRNPVIAAMALRMSKLFCLLGWHRHYAPAFHIMDNASGTHEAVRCYHCVACEKPLDLDFHKNCRTV